MAVNAYILVRRNPARNNIDGDIFIQRHDGTEETIALPDTADGYRNVFPTGISVTSTGRIYVSVFVTDHPQGGTSGIPTNNVGLIYYESNAWTTLLVPTSGVSAGPIEGLAIHPTDGDVYFATRFPFPGYIDKLVNGAYPASPTATGVRLQLPADFMGSSRQILRGFSIRSNGDYVVQSDTRFYIYSGGSWDDGTTITFPTASTGGGAGLSITPSNNYMYMASAWRDAYYAYDGITWGRAVPFPTIPSSDFPVGLFIESVSPVYQSFKSGEIYFSSQNNGAWRIAGGLPTKLFDYANRPTSPQISFADGITVTPNGDIYVDHQTTVSGTTAFNIHLYRNNAYVGVIDYPPGVTRLGAMDADGDDLVVIQFNPITLFRRTAGTWSRGVRLPSDISFVDGLAILSSTEYYILDSPVVSGVQISHIDKYNPLTNTVDVASRISMPEGVSRAFALGVDEIGNLIIETQGRGGSFYIRQDGSWSNEIYYDNISNLDITSISVKGIVSIVAPPLELSVPFTDTTLTGTLSAELDIDSPVLLSVAFTDNTLTGTLSATLALPVELSVAFTDSTLVGDIAVEFETRYLIESRTIIYALINLFPPVLNVEGEIFIIRDNSRGIIKLPATVEGYTDVELLTSGVIRDPSTGRIYVGVHLRDHPTSGVFRQGVIYYENSVWQADLAPANQTRGNISGLAINPRDNKIYYAERGASGSDRGFIAEYKTGFPFTPLADRVDLPPNFDDSHDPKGFTIRNNGDYVLTGTNRDINRPVSHLHSDFYVYNGTSWDDGTAILQPPIDGGSSIGGLSIRRSTDELYAFSDVTRSYYIYSDGNWDDGTLVPNIRSRDTAVGLFVQEEFPRQLSVSFTDSTLTGDLSSTLDLSAVPSFLSVSFTDSTLTGDLSTTLEILTPLEVSVPFINNVLSGTLVTNLVKEGGEPLELSVPFTDNPLSGNLSTQLVKIDPFATGVNFTDNTLLGILTPTLFIRPRPPAPFSALEYREEIREEEDRRRDEGLPMPIAYPILMPTGKISNLTFTMEEAQQVAYSPRSFARNVTDWGGSRIKVDVTLQKMTNSDAAPWRAFFAKMRGAVGTFLLNPYNHGETLQLGEWNNNRMNNRRLVVVSPQRIDTNTVTIQALQTSLSRPITALRESDYIQIGLGQNARLHMVLDDVVLSGSNPTIDINVFPKVRQAHVGEIIHTLEPSGVFHFSEPVAAWTRDRFWHHEITFTAYSLAP